MPRIYVSIGSNIDRDANIRSALRALRERFGSLTVSTVYESEAVGFVGDNFYNLMVAFDSAEPVRAVSAALREIEAAHRRERTPRKFAPRTLDLDLVLYGDQVLKGEGLDIPRDELTRYAFMLAPLAELAPAERHPERGASYAELWAAFDRRGQEIWPAAFEE